MILLRLQSVIRYNFSLEISAPEINRNIKSDRDFKIFEGKKIKLILDNDFEESLILKSEADCFVFKTYNKEVRVLYTDIKKAKLS